MDKKTCDVKTCQREIETEHARTVLFLGLEYDLCEACYQNLKAWQEGFLVGGREPAPSTSAQGWIPLGTSNYGPISGSMTVSDTPILWSGLNGWDVTTS